MTLKELYEKLATLDGGAEMETVIKTELATLRNEAAKARTLNKENTDVAKKLSTVLSGLGLDDDDELEGKVSNMKATLEGIAAKGGKPDEFLSKFSNMEKTVKTLQTQLETANQERTAEKAKRLLTMKQSLAIDALTKGNAANPKEMARLITDNIVGEEDNALVYKLADKDVSIEEGVTDWLKNNSWAVRVDNIPGAGAPTATA